MDAIKLFARSLGDMALGILFMLAALACVTAVPFELTFKFIRAKIYSATTKWRSNDSVYS